MGTQQLAQQWLAPCAHTKTLRYAALLPWHHPLLLLLLLVLLTRS